MHKDLWWYLMIRGISALLLGGFALFAPDLSISVLVTIVGFFCLLDGGIGLFYTLKISELREYRLTSLLSLAIGAVLVVWSSGAVKFVLMLFGAWLLFVGGGQFVTARRMPESDANRGVVMVMGAIAATIGLVLIVWPGTGIVVVSWGVAIAALVFGVQSIYLATRVRHLRVS